MLVKGVIFQGVPVTTSQKESQRPKVGSRKGRGILGSGASNINALGLREKVLRDVAALSLGERARRAGSL